MKKAFLLLALSVVLLSSCTKEAPAPKVESPVATSNEITEVVMTVATPNDMISHGKPYYLSESEFYTKMLTNSVERNDELIRAMSVSERITHFLDALCNQNIDLVDVYTNGWGHNDYVNTKMSYTIDSIESDEERAVAKVTLSVEESECDTFQKGEHHYTVVSNFIPDPCYIQITKDGINLSDNLPQSDDPKLRDAIVFAQNYLEFCFYEEAAYLDYNNIFALLELDMCKYLNVNGSFTLEELRNHIRYRFGGDGVYPELEEAFAQHYDEEKGIYTYPYGQCGSVHARRISEVKTTDKGYTVTFEYFSDMSYLQKCQIVVLTFETNEGTDVTRLTDVEKTRLVNVPFKTYSP